MSSRGNGLSEGNTAKFYIELELYSSQILKNVMCHFNMILLSNIHNLTFIISVIMFNVSHALAINTSRRL